MNLFDEETLFKRVFKRPRQAPLMMSTNIAALETQFAACVMRFSNNWKRRLIKMWTSVLSPNSLLLNGVECDSLDAVHWVTLTEYRSPNSVHRVASTKQHCYRNEYSSNDIQRVNQVMLFERSNKRNGTEKRFRIALLAQKFWAPFDCFGWKFSTFKISFSIWKVHSNFSASIRKESPKNKEAVKHACYKFIIWKSTFRKIWNT